MEAEGQVAIPPTVFHVHERNPDGSLGTYVGGCDDLPSAILIMSAAYSTVQEAYQDNHRVFMVVDDNGTGVAFIGVHPDQPELP